MNLTGNPFVDTGLMVIAALAEKRSVDDLTFVDVKSVYGDGSELARENQRLKSYTMVFGTNGPLTQPAYKKIGKNQVVYLGTMSRLLTHAATEGETGQTCDITGVRSDLNFHKLTSEALENAGLAVPEQKWIGRDWVPLGGSLGNDAQALPGASRPLHVSALALFALQYLPLGVFLFKGKLTCYQSTATEFAQDLVSTVVEKNTTSLDREILGKGAGSRIVLDFLLNHFEELKTRREESQLPENTELLLWLFSNSGTGADCLVEPVPGYAIRFISDACAEYGHEIRRLLANDAKDPRHQLFECIRAGRNYEGLYTSKKTPGASAKFFRFYQERIRSVSSSALSVAEKLARLEVERTAAKDLKDLRKPEFIRAPAAKNRIRRLMVEHLTLPEYDALFPSSRHPIRVDGSAWELIRFYLGQEKLSGTAEESLTMRTTHPKIAQIGDAYFDMRGPKKIKRVLDLLAQKKLGVAWLQDIFCLLAADDRYQDFNLGTWDEFTCDEEGKPIVYELLFQIRLYLANKFRESLTQPTQPKEMTA
jgi:CRISPR-associated protein Cst1